MERYPITSEDFSNMHYRMATGESMTIPVRSDMTLTDGSVIKNMLTWGNPLAYEMYHDNGVLYSRYKHGN